MWDVELIDSIYKSYFMWRSHFNIDIEIIYSYQKTKVLGVRLSASAPFVDFCWHGDGLNCYFFLSFGFTSGKILISAALTAQYCLDHTCSIPVHRSMMISHYCSSFLPFSRLLLTFSQTPLYFSE